MDKGQRASTKRPKDRTSPAPATSASIRSEDLFATVYEQTQRVLGKTCGFYVVTHDSERSVARVAYHADSGSAPRTGVTFDSADCDVLTHRRPIIDDAFARQLTDGVISSIAVPLIRNNEPLGCFGAYSRSESTYDARDARALEAIAEVAALALENARFLSEIEKARLEAERLEEIGRAISGSLDLSEVLRRIVDAAQTLTGADAATVWLLRNEDEVEVAMSIGEIAPPQGLVLPVPASLRHRMADLRKPYFVYEDVKSGEHDLPLNFRNLTKAQSTMAVTLVADDQILGALSVGHKEPVRYSPADIRLLERLSFQAAVAVANARLHEQVSALSLTDPLTDMPNRRHLEIFLEKEFAAARRGRRLSVLLFDLNNFKIYNDRSGHQAGDKALREFGKLLLRNTRAMNLAARLGGDEFITILADTDLAGAQAHAERIVNEIANHPLLASAGLTASVGIATFNSAMEVYDDLISAADEDLYLRKRSRTA